MAETLVEFEEDTGRRAIRQMLRTIRSHGRLGKTGRKRGSLEWLWALTEGPSLLDIIAVLTYDRTIDELHEQLESGDRTAILRLVHVDKSALYSERVREEVQDRWEGGDWEFFRRLGEAIQREPFDREPYLLRAVLVCAYLWDRGLKSATYGRIVEALRSEGLVPGHVTSRSFAKKLNRVGLRRPPGRQSRQY